MLWIKLLVSLSIIVSLHCLVFKVQLLLNVHSHSLPVFISVQVKRLCGGDEEDRTPDPLLARQVLSQLSYTPVF